MIFYYLSYLSIIPIIILGIAIFTAIIISLSSKKNNKKFWLAPFYARDDFLNEIFCISSVFVFCILSIKLFTQYVNLDSLSQNWLGEIFAFGLIAVTINGAYLSRSYITMTIGAYSFYLLTVWSLIRSGDIFFSDNDFKSVSLASILGLSWIGINMLMPLARHVVHFQEHKIWSRFGNLLRFIIISSNVLALGIFSNFYFGSFASFIFKGQAYFFEANVIYVLLGLCLIFGSAILAVLVKIKKFVEVDIFEFLSSIFPGLFLFFLGSFFYEIAESAMQPPSGVYEPGQISIPSGLWLAIFNTLFFVYLIYLLIAASRRKENWLRVYATILMILGVIIKFFDLFSSFTFNGLFFVIFGTVVLVGSFVYIQSINKAKNKQIEE